jgi:ubiquitin carboxyl-terminal hydrolase 6/32
LGGSQPELVTPLDHEITLANGFLYEHEACGNGYSNGQLGNHSEEDSTDDQREETHSKPIYNLYAISVSDVLHRFQLIFLKLGMMTHAFNPST